MLGILNLDLLDTDVTIGDAHIYGGEVNILGEVDTSRYPDFSEYIAKATAPLDGIPPVPSVVPDPLPQPPALPIPDSSMITQMRPQGRQAPQDGRAAGLADRVHLHRARTHGGSTAAPRP